MPSGSGRTAASIMAGGPPTKMLTRNGLPARMAAAWWTPIEALDLVVQADFAVGCVLVAGKLDAVHAEVGMSPAGLGDVFRVDLRQRDERAAIEWPAHLLRQLRDCRFVCGDVGAADELRDGT